MIATNRGNTRECPICGYAEPHEAQSSNTRSNRAARRAQQRSQKSQQSPRPRQQRRAATEARNKAIDERFAKAQAENPRTIIMVDELTLGMMHALDGLGHDQVR
jgi:uncharacterized Zn finger protein (UPF0148 family)